MRNPRRVLSKAQILDRVWSYDFGGSAHVVELYISYLRKKIDAGRPPMIHTVRGVGYVLKPGRDRVRARSGQAASPQATCHACACGCWSSCSPACCSAARPSPARQALALRRFLLDRLDQQLTAAGDRYRGLTRTSRPTAMPTTPQFQSVAGQTAGTLGARVLNGKVTAFAVVGASNDVRSTPRPQRHLRGSARRSHPRTLSLPSLGEYRLIARAGRDGDILITGLPEHSVDETITHLLVIEAVVFAIAVLVSGAVAAACRSAVAASADPGGEHGAAGVGAAAGQRRGVAPGAGATIPRRVPRSERSPTRSTTCSNTSNPH